MADKQTLQKHLAELRSKTLREANGSEKEIRKLYKTLLKDLQGFIATEYAQYAQDGKLTYSMLQQKGEYARFISEVTKRLDGITPEIAAETERAVDAIYDMTYKGMIDAVSTAKGLEAIEEELKSLDAASSVKRSVMNSTFDDPRKLVLKEALEYNRQGIIYNIKKNVSMGLVNGDRYDEIAKRLVNSLDGDYKKSIRIARTETHRVREQGLNDAAVECSNAVKNGNSGLIMVKIWRTGKDKRVRDSHASMEGVTVLADEEFELPSGAVTMTPGSSGVAGEDINCRCYCSYKLMTAEEYAAATGKKTSKEENLGIEAEDKKPFSATKGYTDSTDSYAINEALRYGDSTREFKEVIDRLDKNMSPLKADRELYRGVNIGYVEQFGIDPRKSSSMSFEDLRNALVGKEYTDKGYVSTTYNPEFTGHSNFFWVKVDAKKGTNAIVTSNDKEYEIILSRDTKFKVKDVQMGNGGKIEITLETIPEKKKKGKSKG